jgi:hypothetical protein
VKHLNEWSHKELMALPVRDWQEEKTYDSVLVVSTRKKHDSGWAVMAIIGCEKQEPIEIACACCDDIYWKFPAPHFYGKGFTLGQMRTDCAMKSGALHPWMYGYRFKVGAALSSTEIEVVKA